MQNSNSSSTPAFRDGQLRDRCLSWGFPIVVILVISLFTALRIGASFEQSTFVSIISFITCTILLALIYFIFFQSLPQDIFKLITDKKVFDKGNDSEMSAKRTDAVDKPQEAILDETPSKEDPSPIETYDFNQADYDQLRQDYHHRQEKEHQARVSCVLYYTRYIMSPLMKMEEIEHLCVEVRGWADNPAYRPNPVHMLPNAIKLDAKHYVWNIAERLGKEQSSIEYRSPFIKSLFDDMFHDNDLSSLKNLTVKPNEGTIKIDKPENGSYRFKLPRQKEEVKSGQEANNDEQ